MRPGSTLKNLFRGAACFCLSIVAIAQTPANDPLKALQSEVDELRRMLIEMKGQVEASRRESQELRSALQVMRGQLEKPDTAAAEERLATLAEDQHLISAKVDDQYQTKVASGSKYRVRLSGMAVLNAYSTRGAVDNMDLPGTAQPRAPGETNGNFGATVRQSMLSIEVFGPELWKAKTSGELKFDFFGGFPVSPDGLSAGLVRLRTARIALDWKNTSLVAAQDAPFFSPRSPTSLASIAYPAMSSSGNLWAWTPEVYVDHRLHLADDSTLSLQFGFLDPLTGELPSEYNRLPTAGERSRVPALATKLGWQRERDQRVAAVGAGSYYARQNWGFGRMSDAWAVTGDWDLPLGPWFSFSGELYRGRAIAGLGAGATPSALFNGPPSLATSSALVLNSAGGWSQLKFKPPGRMEFNAAFGEDRPFPHRWTQIQPSNGSLVVRNASGFLNAIYTARSNLLFSLEYRRLWTSRFLEPKVQAGQINLAAGILF